jgi:hypothetical protein
LTAVAIPPEQQPLYFPETDHFVPGEFRDRWNKLGGRELYGIPLTEPFVEGDFIVQIFERAIMVFTIKTRLEPGYNELPELERLRRSVSLAHLGRMVTGGREFSPVAPFASEDRRWYFPEVGHSLEGNFLDYWLAHDGLRLFGYPISEPLVETLGDGRRYTVQYFERARFEHHPEAAGTAHEIQLGQLGREEMRRRGWLP